MRADDIVLIGIITAFGVVGGVLGSFWRWRLWGLLALCVAAGLAISASALATSSGSSPLSVIIDDARNGGSAWLSYVFHGVALFLYTGAPMVIGGGLYLRCMPAEAGRTDGNDATVARVMDHVATRRRRRDGRHAWRAAIRSSITSSLTVEGLTAALGLSPRLDVCRARRSSVCALRDAPDEGRPAAPGGRRAAPTRLGGRR